MPHGWKPCHPGVETGDKLVGGGGGGGFPTGSTGSSPSQEERTTVSLFLAEVEEEEVQRSEEHCSECFLLWKWSFLQEKRQVSFLSQLREQSNLFLHCTELVNEQVELQGVDYFRSISLCVHMHRG